MVPQRECVTEDEHDAMHQIKNDFYDEFGQLIAKYMLRMPAELQMEVQMHLGETASVYSSCYKKYLPAERMF